LTSQYGIYRIFKYEFVASPRIEEIAICVSSRSQNEGVGVKLTTTVYISWNGATKVYSWRIYSQKESGDGKEV
jgi:hypothetical protein